MQRMKAAVNENKLLGQSGSVQKASHATPADVRSREWGISCFPKVTGTREKPTLTTGMLQLHEVLKFHMVCFIRRGKI